MANENTWVYVS